jgi:NitT/TauT family transport system substrate-binding protein
MCKRDRALESNQEELAMLHKTLLTMTLGLALLAATGSAGAQERLRLAWAGFSPTNSPIWVIEDRKLLQKQGVIPEIVAINASPTVLQALLAEEIDAASISVTTLASSRLGGADTVMIVGVVPTFVDHIVALSSITKTEQLKGKTGGVNRLGSTSDLGLRLALRRLGIDPEKDVKIIPVGGNPERFAALSKGLTQFTIMPEPFLTQAERLGFHDLYHVANLKIPFWWNGILSRESIIKTRRPLLQKLTRAMVEAIHIFTSSRPKRSTPRRYSKKTWAYRIRRDSSAPTKITRRFFRNCPIRPPTESRPCSMISRSKIPRRPARIQRHLSI